MRLFGKVNSAIDRFDRAGWLTAPFDRAFVVEGPSECFTAAPRGAVFRAESRGTVFDGPPRGTVFETRDR
jgi:hypothetical protein